MSIFDLFGKKKKADSSLFDQLASMDYYTGKVNVDEYVHALELLESQDKEDRREGLQIMRKLVCGYIKDPRAIFWAAREYEKLGSKASAGKYYKDAYEAGIKEARSGYNRCYNPYHQMDALDIFSSIRETRGCGTPLINANERICKKQKEDYKNALDILNGKPTTEEVQKAAHTIFLIASADGCSVPDAQKWVGDYYENVKKDYMKAAEWFKKSADNGSVEGARCYADMLMAGNGVPQDTETAIKYYRIAADKGHPAAQFVIGQYYNQKGEKEEAQKYFSLSFQGGFGPAGDMLISYDSEKSEQPDNGSATIVEDLDNSFYKTVEDHDLADGSAEFYAPVYQPEEFCDSAYLYCRKQYGTDDKKKLVFEYCMTSFYGAICTVALFHENQEQFNDQKAWDVLYRQINVEFTDANADRLMGTKQGEEKSEHIFSIISMFFNEAYPVIDVSDFKEEVCKHAMHMAYKLGMMVARKEFVIPDCTIVHEELPQSTDDEDEDDDEITSAEIKSPQEFYKDCLKSFHETGADAGYVKHGVIFIPELMPIGERIVKEFLKDPFFISEYGNDPVQYYYAIVGLSLQAGIVIADKWHANYSELKNGFVDEVITDGPAGLAEELMENNFNVNALKANEYYSSIFTKWMQLHHPYWNLKDPRQYTFLGTLAAYQVGISTILGKYGF